MACRHKAGVETMGVRGQRHPQFPSTPGITPFTHLTGGWVGRKDGLEKCGEEREKQRENVLTPPAFEPRTIQPAMNRYTD